MPLSEMFGTFALSVGAAVSTLLLSLSGELVTQKLQFLGDFGAELRWVILIFRWVWSFGQDGLTRLCGTLPCGICMRFVFNISIFPSPCNQFCQSVNLREV